MRMTRAHKSWNALTNRCSIFQRSDYTRIYEFSLRSPRWRPKMTRFNWPSAFYLQRRHNVDGYVSDKISVLPWSDFLVSSKT